MDGVAVKRQMDVVQGMLHKSVMALAIVPTNRSLTFTGRRAYSVMLHLAQQQAASGAVGKDGGFSAPLNSILRGFGATNTISMAAKKYIDQMVSTKVEWRPLSKSEQQLSLAFGREGEPEGGDQASITDETRIFNLLAEVRLYKRAGENWVTWFYPPSIREELVNPTRWAQIDFEVLRQLTTYCSVSMYEICARYRDSPGGLTSRQHWTWWEETLRNSPTSKGREWRKFKNEFVTPAIREINGLGDIEIDLIEFRRGREVEFVQFGVKKSARRHARALPTAPDLTNIVRAESLGVRDTVIEELERGFGVEAVEDGLERFARFLSGGTGQRIGNAGAYLKQIIANKARGEAGAVQGAGVGSQAQEVVEARVAPKLATFAEDVKNAERHRRMTMIRTEFAKLQAEEHAEWLRMLREESDSPVLSRPIVLKRMAQGEWQSPLVEALIIPLYAKKEIDDKWATMTNDAFDLLMASRFSVDAEVLEVGSRS